MKDSDAYVESRNAWVFLWVERRLLLATSYKDLDKARAAAERLAEERAMMSEESTTPDLVELVRRSNEAAKRGYVDTILSNFGPNSIWDDTAIGLGVHDGLNEIREHIEDWIGAYEEFEIEMEEWLHLGNGVTLEVNLQRGRPVGSSGHVQLRYAGVTVWVDGKVERFTTYTDIAEARAAAERLAESRAQADG